MEPPLPPFFAEIWHFKAIILYAILMIWSKFLNKKNSYNWMWPHGKLRNGGGTPQNTLAFSRRIRQFWIIWDKLKKKIPSDFKLTLVIFQKYSNNFFLLFLAELDNSESFETNLFFSKSFCIWYLWFFVCQMQKLWKFLKWFRIV